MKGFKKVCFFIYRKSDNKIVRLIICFGTHSSSTVARDGTVWEQGLGLLQFKKHHHTHLSCMGHTLSDYI